MTIHIRDESTPYIRWYSSDGALNAWYRLATREEELAEELEWEDLTQEGYDSYER
jgi:hypothetical protein